MSSPPDQPNSNPYQPSQSMDPKARDARSARDGWGNFWMPKIWWKPAPNLGEQARRRVSVHLIPVLFTLYIIAYIDRSNIGWASLDMSKSPAEGGLGLMNETIGFGAGMFFWSYWILEIPSTLSVLKRGARWVFIRILLLWGIAATLMGFLGDQTVMPFLFGWLPKIQTDIPGLAPIANYIGSLESNAAYQLYFFRFLLGLFEGGFFPTVIFYLSIWFRTQDRAKAMALFLAAIPLASAFGAAISKKLLLLDWFGLEGWRWVFIIQGIMPIVAAFVTAFVLPDRISEARWLPPDERELLEKDLAAEQSHGKLKHGFAGFKSQIGVVALLTIVYFGQNVSSYGLSTFMPKIYENILLDEDGKKLDSSLQAARQAVKLKKTEARKTLPANSEALNTELARIDAESKPELDRLSAELKVAKKPGEGWLFWLTSATYIVAFLGMLYNGHHSDKHGERVWHVAVPLMVLGTCIALVGLTFTNMWLGGALLLFGVGFFHYMHLPAFWPIPTMFLGSTAAASAIGFINMIGNLGGSVGQILVGELADTSFSTAMLTLAPFPIVSGLIVLGISMKKHK
jgi:MFS family permease